MSTVYQNDVGTEIRLDTGIDLLGASLIEIRGRKPSGSSISWTAIQYVDPVSGPTQEITYTTLPGDLDEVGSYILQAYVESGASSKHYGEVVLLPVMSQPSAASAVLIVRIETVRFKIQDRDGTDPFFTDAEIEAELYRVNDSVLRAAENLARTLGARFSKKITKNISGVGSINYSDLAKQYFALADQLREEREYGNGCAYPSSGSSNKDSIFHRDMMTIGGCETEDDDGVAD
jgi:hypothetical protein